MLPVPFSVLGDYPPLWNAYPSLAAGRGGLGLSEELAAGFGDAFVPDLSSLVRRIRLRQQRQQQQQQQSGSSARRLALVTALRVYHESLGLALPAAVTRSLARLADPATVTVVTGQQPSLLGGPGYVLSKALTTVALAAALEREGVRAVPVFWIGSEDHDVTEANTVWLPGKLGDPTAQALWQQRAAAGALQRLHFACGFERRSPLRRTRLDSLARTTTTTTRVPLEDMLLDEHDAHTLNAWLAPLQDAPPVEANETLGRWQARGLLATLGEQHGMLVVEPWVLRPLQGQLVAEALAQHSSLAPSLAMQAAHAADAIPSLAEFAQPQPYPPVFYLASTGTGATRQRRHLVPTTGTNDDHAGFVLEDAPLPSLPRSDPAFAVRRLADWQALARAHPERFSTSALLRPVVQDALLDCVAYAAGPSELAYNLLCRQWHAALGVEPAALVRRLCVTVVPESQLDLAAEALALRATARHAVAALRFDRPDSLESVHRDLLQETRAALDELASHGGPVLGGMRATIDGLIRNVPRRLARHVQRSADAPQEAFAQTFTPRHQAAIRYYEPLSRHLQERTLPWLALDWQTIRNQLTATPDPLPQAHILVVSRDAQRSE